MVGFCMKTAPFIVAAHEQGVDPHPKNGRAWRTLGSGANTVEAPLLNAQARTFSLHFFYSEASFSWNVEPPIELMRTWYHVTPLLKTWYLSAITEITYRNDILWVCIFFLNSPTCSSSPSATPALLSANPRSRKNFSVVTCDVVTRKRLTSRSYEEAKLNGL